MSRSTPRCEGGWEKLKALMRANVVRAFYFSVAPSLFGDLAEKLHEHDIADAVEPDRGGKAVRPRSGVGPGVERDAGASISREDQIYRIDHYLGKETVQNLMAVRFANILFEPLWKAEYVDHVQITVAETVGRRWARRLLRQVGRDARHGAEPHDAAAVPDRDGAALSL